MENLAEQLNILRTIADASPDWEEWIDKDGNVDYISSSCEIITGYNRDEFLKNPGFAEEIIHPADQSLFATYCNQREIDPTKPISIEYRIIHHDGGERWIELHDIPIYMPDNRLLGRRISHRDITERKRTEEEFRQNHQILETLMIGLSEVFVVADANAILLFCNQVLAQNLRTNKDELIGKYCWDFFPPEIAEPRKKAFETVIQTGQLQRVQEKGMAGIFDSLYIPIFDQKGEVEKVAVLSNNITEQKNVEEALRESEEKYKFLAENSNDVIWIRDLDMKLLYINPAIERFRGYTIEEVMQQPYESTLTPTSFTIAREAHLDRLKKEKSGIYEIRRTEPIELEYTCKDGSTVWGESNISLMRDSNGELIGLLGVTRYITERKKAEEELRRSEQLLSTVVQSAPVISAIMDKQGIIKWAEGKGFQVTGYKPKDLVGKNILAVSKYPVEMEHRLKRVLAGEEFTEMDTESIRGSKFKTHYIPLRDEQNNVEGVITVSIDVSDYLRMQEELRQSRDQLEAILNGVADGISVLNNKGDLIYANQTAANRMGYSSSKEMLEDDIFPSFLEYFDENGGPLPPEQRPRVQALKGIANPPTIYRYRLRDTPHDRWVVITTTPVFDEDGEVQMVVFITHDISELKYAQIELQKAHDELEQRIEERTSELAQSNQQLLEEIEMRKHVEQALQRKVVHSEALAHIAARINTKLDLKGTMETICTETALAMNYPGSAIFLLNEETDCLELVANSLENIPDPDLSIPKEVYEKFLETFGPVIVIPDVSALSINPHPELTAKRGTRTVVSAPLMHDGLLVGSLTVSSLYEIRLPVEDEISLLRGFADQASVAIINARFFEQISRNQQEMQALSERLVRVQEEERRSLAGELHDQVGQMLTTLNLHLDLLSKSLQEKQPSISRIQDDLDNSKVMVNNLLEQVRELSLELRPRILDDLGLLPALVDHFNRFNSQTNLHIDFKHSGLDNRFPLDIETAAFRIIQEAITNVARHARVEKVSVHMWVDQQKLKLQVEDQGVGFDMRVVEHANNSIGLISMRERASFCRGVLEVETSTDNGVLITAELPFDEGVQN